MAVQPLLLALAVLRLTIPSLGLAILLFQGVSRGFGLLFQRLQASSFLETGNGYKRIPSSSNGPANRDSVFLPPDENGILPVMVPVKSRRRGLIYSSLSLAAVLYLVSATLFIIHSIVSGKWQSTYSPLWRYMEFYTIGSALSLFGQSIIMAWQERKAGLGRFRTGASAFLAALLSVGDVAVLALMASQLKMDSKKVHTWRGRTPLEQDPVVIARLDAWTIAQLAISGLRIIVLLLAALSFAPCLMRTEYKPNEYSSLTSAQQSGAATPSNGYGTFNGNRSNLNSKPSSLKGKTEDAKPSPSFLARIKILGPHLWPRKSRTLQAVALFCFALLGVGRVVNLFVPRTLGKVVEDLSSAGQQSPWRNLILYCALRFLQGSGGLVQVLSNNLWVPVAQYSEREMSQMTFAHLLNLSYSFQVKKKTGEVLRVLDRGSAINNLFQILLFQLVPIAVDITIAIVYLWVTFGLLLASLVTAIMITYVFVSVVLTNVRTKYRKEMNERDKYTRGILADALANWETIKFFTAESREQTRYVTALKDYQRSDFKVTASLNFLNLIQNAVTSLGLIIGSLVVAFSVVQGTRTVGQFVMFLTYLTQLYGPLNILGTLYRVLQMNITDTDNLMKLLAEEKEIVDKPDAEELVNAKGGIQLDHVNFSYDGRVTALKDISVDIPPGTSVALVGESGAGKSTLLRLLYRFYEVTDGAIRFDGKDVRDITQLSLRGAIGVVPQETVLFNESILYNLQYGRAEATLEDIENAAKAARIYDRIMSFPDGWETKVGERGVRLSGGEKQRVSIARALLKNPAILLLDEATSALDTGTEREIQQALQKLAEGRTSIAIAHRLSTITYSDLILVLKDGTIAERGDHKTLLAQKGLYYDLWQKQIRAENEAVEDVKQAAKIETPPSEPIAHHEHP